VKILVTKLIFVLFKVILVFSCSLSFASISTHTIVFKNNENLTLNLSSDDPNRIFIEGEKIINVSCPDGFCIIDTNHLETTGNVLINLGEEAYNNHFTMYISGEHGSEVSILVQAKHIQGQTIGLMSGKKRITEFDKKNDYRQLIIKLMKSMIKTHQTGNIKNLPEGYYFEKIDIKNSNKSFPKTGISFVHDSVMRGGIIFGQVYVIQNTNKDSNKLYLKSFYKKNMIAVALSKEFLLPGETCFLYILMQEENHE